MQANEKLVLIYSTYASPAEAERIGEMLIDRGLVACVNIFPGMTSIYVWEGKRQRETETAMIIKTRAAAAGKVMAEVRARHSNANPALVVLPIVEGSSDFYELDRSADGKGGVSGGAAACAAAGRRRAVAQPITI